MITGFSAITDGVCLYTPSKLQYAANHYIFPAFNIFHLIFATHNYGKMKRDLMKKTLLTLALVMLLLTAANAQSKGLGLGIIIGEPTGVTLKVWQGGNVAFDAAAAWSFKDEGAFHVHADFLWHNFGLISVTQGDMALYYGVGGRIKFREDRGLGDDDDALIGVRFPLGLAYYFQPFPGELFVEVVPLLNVAPSTDFDLNGALGFRYYFN